MVCVYGGTSPEQLASMSVLYPWASKSVTVGIYKCTVSIGVEYAVHAGANPGQLASMSMLYPWRSKSSTVGNNKCTTVYLGSIKP